MIAASVIGVWIFEAHRDASDHDAALDHVGEQLEVAAEVDQGGALVGQLDLGVAGGVGANKKLRKTLVDAIGECGGRVHYPRPEFCTDNGSMIAYTGFLRLKAGESDSGGICVRARWPLDQLSPP